MQSALALIVGAFIVIDSFIAIRALALNTTVPGAGYAQTFRTGSFRVVSHYISSKLIIDDHHIHL